MKAGDQSDLFLFAVELHGALNFAYYAPKFGTAELLKARLFYLRTLLLASLPTFFPNLQESQLLFFDIGSSSMTAIFRTGDQAQSEGEIALENGAIAQKNFVSEKLKQTNKWFQDYLCGNLVLDFYLEPLASLDARVLQEHRASASKQFQGSGMEKGRASLKSIFRTRESKDEQCDLCARDDMPISEISQCHALMKACSFCVDLLDRFRNGQGAPGPESNLFPPVMHSVLHQLVKLDGTDKPDEMEKTDVLAKIDGSAKTHRLAVALMDKHCKTIGCDSQMDPDGYDDQNAILHFSFKKDAMFPTSAIRLGERVKSGKTATLKPFWELEQIVDKQMTEIGKSSKSTSQGTGKSDFVLLESNSENIIVLGKLIPLMELAYRLDESINFKFSAVDYAVGLANSLSRQPLSLLHRQAVQMCYLSRSSGQRHFALNFGGDSSSSISCFSFDEWRKQVKPLTATLKTLDQLNALGYTFFDYLLDLSRSRSISIYPLMYRIARREESHAELRRNQTWQHFKAELILTLSSRNEEQLRKRRMLSTALACFLFSKKHLHTRVPERELIQLGRR